jgi:hypothetical protein
MLTQIVGESWGEEGTCRTRRRWYDKLKRMWNMLCANVRIGLIWFTYGSVVGRCDYSNEPSVLVRGENSLSGRCCVCLLGWGGGAVGQAALVYTELYKRCVQEQSGRSLKLSINLRIMPRLRSSGNFCHFPIHFHREKFKMSFRAHLFRIFFWNVTQFIVTYGHGRIGFAQCLHFEATFTLWGRRQ